MSVGREWDDRPRLSLVLQIHYLPGGSSVHVPSNSSGESHVLGHDGDPAGVYATKHGVFHERDQVGLGSLLQGHHGHRLEAEVVHAAPPTHVDGNLLDQSGERETRDEEVVPLLIPTDLPQCHGARSVAARRAAAWCGLGATLARGFWSPANKKKHERNTILI